MHLLFRQPPILPMRGWSGWPKGIVEYVHATETHGFHFRGFLKQMGSSSEETSPGLSIGTRVPEFSYTMTFDQYYPKTCRRLVRR